MTIEQIERLVRDANPVPDVRALEPIDLSDLHVTQQRSGDMQTQDRIDVDREPERPDRRLLIGVAAAAILLIGVLAVFLSRDQTPVVDQPTVTTQAPDDVAIVPATDVATDFVGAYADGDLSGAAALLAAGTTVDFLAPAPWWDAIGFKVLPGTCEEVDTTTEGTKVSCPFDYNSMRSDQMGLGPYTDSNILVTVLNGEVSSATMDLVFETNGFSTEVWEPFALWISQNYPDDGAVMYQDTNYTQQSETPESIARWDQHLAEYVGVAGTGIAQSFVGAFADGDTSFSGTAGYLADGATVDLPDDAWWQAIGFKVLPGTCAVKDTTVEGIKVSCPFDYHSMRSDEMGLGPYSGSTILVIVLNGEVSRVSTQLVFDTNGFSAEVWEPFAHWIDQNYPDDGAVMYEDPNYTLESHTPESIALWDQHLTEYVGVVNG